MNKPLIIFLAVIFSFAQLLPCTTAVVSGKATDDGRPLLLKNRDADALQNRLVHFFDGKFKFVGLVNSRDKENSEVWTGFNDKGFGIMNSASYNLKVNDTTRLKDREGIIMKMALSQCSSLEDFEKLLSDLPKPLGVEANFGVIDAHGGAAYYEVDNFSFKKFDVNDPSVAPEGYLIRTNYSFSGTDNKGFGYIRYATAAGLFKNQFNNGKISFDFLINDVPRCLIHSYTEENLSESLPESVNDTSYVFFRDYIPRYSSSAAIVIQGVKEKENTALTTMWSIIGFPLTSVIIPVWITEDGTLPEILQADESGNAPLCNIALRLKDKVFPSQNDAKESYINVAALMNKENSGVRQRIIPVENEVLRKSKQLIEKWRNEQPDAGEAKDFYQWVDNYVIPELESIN